MIKINVNTREKYNVIIGNNIIDYVLKEIGKNSNKKVLVISDDNVWNIYKNIFEKSDILSYILKSGEESKTLESVYNILEYMANNSFSKNDLVVGFGGGIVGDIAGFVAAIYMRGIDFIQIPTTLLSAVDASVGGKNGVNFLGVKNIIGTIKQPKSVFCDINFLKTLDNDIFYEGMAEVIKYAILFDKNLFDVLYQNKLEKGHTYLKNVIKKSIEYKAKVVERDELDCGERKLLNLGHTIGHAIEKISNNKISHGFAVAIGICIIADISYKNGYLSFENKKIIKSIFDKYHLPTSTYFSGDDIFNISIKDKKRINGEIEIILINDIGNCFIKKISLDEWYKYIKECCKIKK